MQTNRYAASNSLSLLSNSTSTRRNSAKRLTSPPPKGSPSPKKMRKANTDGSFNADDDKDDREADYVPVTDAAVSKVMEGKGTTWDDHPLSKQHRKAFYLRAFPPVNPDQSFNKPQSKSASIAQCRPKSEVDYIVMVVRNWDKGKEICTMEDGEEKDDLLRFCQQHKVGNKYIHQYCVDEIFPPGAYQPRYVLKHLEKSKDKPHEMVPGRIVLSRDELFDAIDEWHHQNGHLGQERTWKFCHQKYWNVTQDHVKHYCMT
jgi:hypothetical protein